MTLPPPRPLRPAAPRRRFRSALLRHPSARAGAALLAPVLALAIAGPALYPADPFAIAAAPLRPPGPGLPLGSDFAGRDLLAGLAHGGRTTLAVAAAAALMTVVAGVAVGAVAGFRGGLADALLMRLTEFFQVLPPLPFAMVALSLFGPSLPTVAVAIAAASWPPLARLARAEVMRIAGLGHVTASRAVGSSGLRLLLRTILPGALPTLVAAATLAVGAAILFETGLAFLGLVDPDRMSWGSIIGGNRDFALAAWWTVLPPGLATFMTVLGVSLLGDGVTGALDPRAPGGRQGRARRRPPGWRRRGRAAPQPPDRGATTVSADTCSWQAVARRRAGAGDRP